MIRQGGFLGRPSILHARVSGDPDSIGSVEVSSPVAMVAYGTLDWDRLASND